MKNISFLNGLVVASFLTYLFDIVYSRKLYEQCMSDPTFHFNQFIHHMLCYFILFGWLADDFFFLSVHIIVVFLVLSHNDETSGCNMTRLFRKKCGVSDKNPFHSVHYYLGFNNLKGAWKMFLHLFMMISLFKMYARLCRHTRTRQ